jgi:hypothetical protein
MYCAGVLTFDGGFMDSSSSRTKCIHRISGDSLNQRIANSSNASTPRLSSFRSRHFLSVYPGTRFRKARLQSLLARRMFDYESASARFSGALFVLQLVLAPIAGLIFGSVIFIVLEEALHIHDSNLLAYLIFSLQGFVLGYMVQSSIPRATASGGRWIWILPVGILAWSLSSDVGLFGARAIGDQLWPGPGNPGGAYLMFLITLPTVVSCFYSLGIGAANRIPTSTWEVGFRRLISGRDRIVQQSGRNSDSV